MKIIISPAKKMNIVDDIAAKSKPIFLDETQEIVTWLKKKNEGELKNIWKCSDKITQENIERLKKFDAEKAYSPAILSYEGIQYQYMAPSVFENSQYEYLQNNLRIISGLYGVLKPMDAVMPYRLEMQAKVSISGHSNLYEYWGRKIYDEIIDDSHIIINLASKEYSKCVEKYLSKDDKFITCIFGEMVNGKVVQKGVYAKMARGEMVRYMAERQIDDVENIKDFNYLGYSFDEKLSTDSKYVFICDKKKAEQNPTFC